MRSHILEHRSKRQRPLSPGPDMGEATIPVLFAMWAPAGFREFPADLPPRAARLAFALTLASPLAITLGWLGVWAFPDQVGPATVVASGAPLAHGAALSATTFARANRTKARRWAAGGQALADPIDCRHQ